MTHDRTSHWQSVYRTKQPTEVSWFKPHLETSMDLMKRAGLNERSRVLDVGAGASTLVDDLLQIGVRSITALDLSEASLSVARERLAEKASHVQWLVGDVTDVPLPEGGFHLWHDRAALHFLVEPAAAASYVRQAKHAIVDGGYAVIGCFAADGPEKCSGLPVARRDPQDIAALFGPSFALVDSRRETHATPSGGAQLFAYALLRKLTPAEVAGR
jgi:hypothetical protein